MQRKAKYYKILGINPTEDQRVIKKAYRKLALRYHPDRNKSSEAHFKFIEITRAYEILSGQVKLPKQKGAATYRPKTKEEIFAEKVKLAKERYQQQMQEEARKEALYYKRVASGWKWRVFQICAVYTLLFTFLMIADYFADGRHRTIPVQIASYGYMSKSITVEKEQFKVDMEGFWSNPNGFPPMYGTYSFFFHDLRTINIIKGPLAEPRWGHSRRIQKYESFDHYDLYSQTSSNSIYGAFPILHATLMVPFLLIVFKRPTLRFNVWRMVSIWVIYPLMIFLAFSNDRIYYLFGLMD